VREANLLVIKAFGAASKQYISSRRTDSSWGFYRGDAIARSILRCSTISYFLIGKADESEANRQLAKQSNRYAIVPDPDHLGSDGKKHSHTFLIDQNTGTVWDLYCRADKSANFRPVPVDGISNPIMSAAPK
jgi:hypothetical protein